MSDNNYSKPLGILEAADREGSLTETGKALLADVRKIAADAEGNLGMLLPRGGREHRHIMERTVARYPEIFSGKDCRIDVYSSTVQRCLMSMAYSLDAITAVNPNVWYDRHCGSKIQETVFNSYPVSAASGEYGKDFNPRLYEETDNDALFSKIFTYTEAQKKEFLDYTERVNFLRWIWELAIDNALNDELGVDLYKYFDYDDFYPLWRVNNWKEYFIIGPSREFGEIVRDEAATNLRHIIEHADKALAGDGYRATLRYGHDSQLAPLAVRMDIEGCCSPASDPDHPEASWKLDDICPMGANFQMVFFRKKGSDDILVKVLLNEVESRVAGVATDRWPFYHWSDLRAHYMETLEKEPAFNKAGWQVDTVQEGVVYKRYSGVDEVSGVHQLVHAVDVDMDNPRYEVKLAYEEAGSKTSDAFRKAGAIATINGTYGQESVFINEDGKISLDKNSDAVPFKGERLPRTAVAVTADNHLLLVVVDGRRPGIAEGMNAFELASFLEQHFQPARTMDLDCGSSSTMCVKKHGSGETNVVNYPSASRSFMHDKERLVKTHIHILDRDSR